MYTTPKKSKSPAAKKFLYETQTAKKYIKKAVNGSHVPLGRPHKHAISDPKIIITLPLQTVVDYFSCKYGKINPCFWLTRKHLHKFFPANVLHMQSTICPLSFSFWIPPTDVGLSAVIQSGLLLLICHKESHYAVIQAHKLFYYLDILENMWSYVDIHSVTNKQNISPMTNGYKRCYLEYLHIRLPPNPPRNTTQYGVNNGKFYTLVST